MNASSGWTKNPNPQPGDFLLRSNDGLLVTPFDGQTGALVSRRDRIPDMADLIWVVQTFFPRLPVVMEVPGVYRQGGSAENAVKLRVVSKPGLAECLGVCPTTKCPPFSTRPQLEEKDPEQNNNMVRAWQNVDRALDALLSAADADIATGAAVEEGTGSSSQLRGQRVAVAMRAYQLLLASKNFFLGLADPTGYLATQMLMDMAQGHMNPRAGSSGWSEGEKLMLGHLKELGQSMLSGSGVEHALRRIEMGYPEEMRQGALWVGDVFGFNAD